MLDLFLPFLMLVGALFGSEPNDGVLALFWTAVIGGYVCTAFTRVFERCAWARRWRP